MAKNKDRIEVLRLHWRVVYIGQGAVKDEILTTSQQYSSHGATLKSAENYLKRHPAHDFIDHAEDPKTQKE